ncbi:MAG: hypothetical protein VZR95_07360 [Alphaproteobacteria bacterium]
MSDNSELEVIFDTCNLCINLGESAELECHAAVQFIKSGQQEIDDYVSNVILPQLQHISDQLRKEG